MTCTPKFYIWVTCLFLFVFLHMATRIEVLFTQKTSGKKLTSQTGVNWTFDLSFCLLFSLVLKITVIIRYP